MSPYVCQLCDKASKPVGNVYYSHARAAAEKRSNEKETVYHVYLLGLHGTDTSLREEKRDLTGEANYFITTVKRAMRCYIPGNDI